MHKSGKTETTNTASTTRQIEMGNLTDFMIENRLACLNTNYQKSKLWTYTGSVDYDKQEMEE